MRQEHLDRALEFMGSKARTIDYKLVQYELQGGNKSEVIDELLKFQNADGGFGISLESDIRMETSSPYVTTVAFQYLNWLQIDTNHPMVKAGIDYFVNTVNRFHPQQVTHQLSHFWHPVGTEIKNIQHAPWWSVDELLEPDITHWSNPNVEIIGYLNQYNQFVDEEFLDELNNSLRYFLKTQQNLEPSTHYNFYCWKRALPHLPTDLEEPAYRFLERVFEGHDFLSDEVFNHHKVQWLITEKSSMLYQLHKELFDKQIELEILRQHDDGGWYPTWTWGEEAMWNTIKYEWAGKITAEFLMLQKYLGNLP